MQMIQIELPRAKHNTFPPRNDFSLTDWWLSILKFAPQYTQEKSMNTNQIPLRKKNMLSILLQKGLKVKSQGRLKH